MRLGLHQISFGFAGGPPEIAPTLSQLAAAAEDVGVDNISAMDHYFQLPYVGGPAQPMLEGYTTLGFLAGKTSRLDLQLLVTGVTYRHPGLLAKIVTTLDVLSGGRAVLGLGAAWYEREHLALGVRFPPAAERFERLEEALQVVRQMWSSDDGPFEGKHYQLAETLNDPQPLRRPPIMVGGQGERKTLRLVAKYADACNLFAHPNMGPNAFRQKMDVLAEHCEREGTDFGRIRKTILWSDRLDPDRDAATFLEHMSAYAELGVEEVHVMDFDNRPVDFVRGLGRSVLPQLHQIR
jgi:F420-dependent oxidoreductase-like protein